MVLYNTCFSVEARLHTEPIMQQVTVSFYQTLTIELGLILTRVWWSGQLQRIVSKLTRSGFVLKSY
jgi:hypothetical protein